MNRVRMHGLGLVARFVACIFPEVESELSHWRQRLEAAGDQELRSQGLASIGKKRFHAQGGQRLRSFCNFWRNLASRAG